MANKPNWTVGAARNLPVIERTRWDATAAQKRIFVWAGWPDNPKPGKAKQAFLVYDTKNAGNKGAYKLPFADISDGRLVAVLGALRAAASRLPQTDIPKPTQNKARAVLDKYFSRLKKAINLRSKHDDLHTIMANHPDTDANYGKWINDGHDMIVAEMAKCGAIHPQHITTPEDVSIPIIKAGDKQLAYGVVLKPNVPDLQGDIISAEDVERAAHNWMRRSRLYDYQHQTTLWEGEAIPVESWIAPFDLTPELGWPKFTPKGAWILVSYIPDPDIWQQVKSGKLRAYSIRGWGLRRPLQPPMEGQS